MIRPALEALKLLVQTARSQMHLPDRVRPRRDRCYFRPLHGRLHARLGRCLAGAQDTFGAVWSGLEGPGRRPARAWQNSQLLLGFPARLDPWGVRLPPCFNLVGQEPSESRSSNPAPMPCGTPTASQRQIPKLAGANRIDRVFCRTRGSRCGSRGNLSACASRAPREPALGREAGDRQGRLRLRNRHLHQGSPGIGKPLSEPRADVDSDRGLRCNHGSRTESGWGALQCAAERA